MHSLQPHSKQYAELLHLEMLESRLPTGDLLFGSVALAGIDFGSAESGASPNQACARVCLSVPTTSLPDGFLANVTVGAKSDPKVSSIVESGNRQDSTNPWNAVKQEFEKASACLQRMCQPQRLGEQLRSFRVDTANVFGNGSMVVAPATITMSGDKELAPSLFKPTDGDLQAQVPSNDTRAPCTGTLDLDITAPPVVVRGAPVEWQFHTTDTGPPTGLIRDMIGSVQAVSQAIANPIDDIRDARAWESILYIAGQEEIGDNVAAGQQFNLTTLTAEAPLILHSLDWINNPETGNDNGIVRDIQKVGANVSYYGGADSPNSTGGNPEGTIWDLSGNPSGIGFLDELFKQSDIEAAATNGILVGEDADSAFVHLGGTGIFLDSGNSIAIDILDDAGKIAGYVGNGAEVWRWVGPGPLDYQGDQFPWQIPPNGTPPDYFRSIADAPCYGDPAFPDFFLDTSVFHVAAGAWNTDTGAVEWRSVHSRIFADQQVVGQDVVVAINNSGGGGAELWGLRDTGGLRMKEDLLPNSPYISIEALPGGLFIHENTVGVVAEGRLPSNAKETFVATLNLLPPGGGGGGPYTYDIDWNNDGAWDETQVGGDTISVKHVFPNAGAATVRAQVNNGSSSSDAELHPLAVLPWATQTVGNRVDLIVGGTAHSDTLTYQSAGGSYDLELNGRLISSLTGIDRVVFWAQDGNDTANMLGLPREAALYGGEGNDVLFNAFGPSLLVGGGGADQLNAVGGQKNFLLGGAGGDFLASTGQNLGISGFTDLDAEDPTLYDALTKWNANTPLSQRIAEASATFNPTVVFDDLVTDFLVARAETMYALWNTGDATRGPVAPLY